ncbi:hypothetical protein [Amycolatopsis sp. DSM 110486]|uniref:hypothetical protein n=1 Tax=Amycolatopsis sp. DSM 110486 TaxID=2865832 RepID=UPI001C6A220A|nr:hypothetical protein [Amycolatopsis sp. DSM 110486]QYN16839.1 hypothetical protein K1T34_28755 [Amycolatopsis sp. DSM 110486]
MSHASAAARLHQLAGQAIARIDGIVGRLDHTAERLATSGSLIGPPVDRGARGGFPLPTHSTRSTGHDQAEPAASGSVDTRQRRR